MNIALIGSGGREHALCQKIYDYDITNKIYCIPGNAGTSHLAKNFDIDFLTFNYKKKSVGAPDLAVSHREISNGMLGVS